MTTIEWTVSHLDDGTVDYHYRSPDMTREALINGDGKEWTYFAGTFPDIYTARDGKPLSEIKGSTVSVDSAKDDIRRWFAEIATPPGTSTEADRE